MSTTAELIIKPDDFLLSEIITNFPDISVELDRVVPTRRQLIPYLWGYGSDLVGFEAALGQVPEIRDITVLDRTEDGALYKIRWEMKTNRLMIGLAETNATIIKASGTDHWRLLIRFEKADGLSSFGRYCDRHDISYRLARVNPSTDLIIEQTLDLTPEQEEALAVAVAQGYFEIPREVIMADLAADLEISEQAMSERMRRGLNNVLKQVQFDASPTHD
jgi:predicted DNA binding protein